MEDLPSGFALDQMVHEAQKMEDRTYDGGVWLTRCQNQETCGQKTAQFVVVGNNG